MTVKFATDPAPADDYTDWHPARQVAAAHRYARLMTQTTTNTPAEQPTERPAPMVRLTREQLEQRHLARQRPCPAYGGASTHFILGPTQTCHGCGATVTTILNTEQETHA